MIKYLDGVRETVGFENNSSLMLFDNTDYEEYPVHWHTPIELIMPTEGTYDVDCNQIPFHMRKGDIIVIIPGTLHHMKACHGRRIIFQVDMNSGKPFEEFAAFLPFLQPAVLITPEEAPAIHEEAEKLCQFDNQQAPLTVRTNTLKTSPSELFLQLTSLGVEATRSQLVDEGYVLENYGSLDNLAPLQEGYCQVQDESSMLVAHVVDPQPGELVLDVCSAPGGKTTHMAALMENRGRIVACDIYDHKLQRVMENAARLGINIIDPMLMDAREIHQDFPQQADRVLVDAPCSGLGVLRRKPDSRWRKTQQLLKELPKLQLEILKSAAACVKPGGILVYSTCTIAREENQAVVEKFLKDNAEFQLEHTGSRLPVPREDVMVQLYPQRDGTDGFFIACMRRK